MTRRFKIPCGCCWWGSIRFRQTDSKPCQKIHVLSRPFTPENPAQPSHAARLAGKSSRKNTRLRLACLCQASRCGRGSRTPCCHARHNKTVAESGAGHMSLGTEEFIFRSCFNKGTLTAYRPAGLRNRKRQARTLALRGETNPTHQRWPLGDEGKSNLDLT